MEELGYAQTEATPMFEDNMACIYMSESSASFHKVQHIDTRVFHLSELCKTGITKLEKVESSKMAADSLTKATPQSLPLFKYHRNVIMGHPQVAGA
eukprot:1629329-Rhodomonas_salina.1